MGLILGLFQTALGFAFALEFIPMELMGRYSIASTTGEAINRGMLVAGIAVAAGAISEIGLALGRAGQ
ncbi:hypothetical protein [Devosia enhydra]|uniref:hypothetical protein n=1 Tax=Devosia enhydra TaxID=665118 RepID=UPI0011603EFB|nr:hypothetical protein [Devosia enhydra]